MRKRQLFLKIINSTGKLILFEKVSNMKNEKVKDLIKATEGMNVNFILL